MKFTWEQITETATSDKGMTKADAARFHYFNPNGAIAQLPEFDDFCFGDVFAGGCHFLYGRHQNYHAKQIAAWATGKKKTFSRWDLDNAVAGVLSDAADAKVALAKKAEQHSETA